MTDALGRLERAQAHLEHSLHDLLFGINLESQYPRLFITLRDGIVIYVRYNDHEQYSYSILFSASEFDRCRFDNFDDKWIVTSKPHHFHPRTIKTGIASPMHGDPEKDMPVLCRAIKDGVLFSKDCKF